VASQLLQFVVINGWSLDLLFRKWWCRLRKRSLVRQGSGKLTDNLALTWVMTQDTRDGQTDGRPKILMPLKKIKYMLVYINMEFILIRSGLLTGHYIFKKKKKKLPWEEVALIVTVYKKMEAVEGTYWLLLPLSRKADSTGDWESTNICLRSLTLLPGAIICHLMHVTRSYHLSSYAKQTGTNSLNSFQLEFSVQICIFFLNKLGSSIEIIHKS